MSRKPRVKARQLKRVLFVPDTHVPYEDARAFELMLKAMRDWRPDTIVILGDFADCFTVSSHSKSPDRVNKLGHEITAVNRRLSQLDALGARAKYYIEGNHEDRLARFIADKAPELFGLVDVPTLLGLAERGWAWTPYKQSLQLGHLNCTHDVGTAGATAHTKALATFQGNVIIGHTHRLAVAYEGNAKGEAHVGMMAGWLGDVDKADYMHKVNALRSWQLGFAVGYQEPSGVIHLQAVPMIAHSLVLEGRLYRG